MAFAYWLISPMKDTSPSRAALSWILITGFTLLVLRPVIQGVVEDRKASREALQRQIEEALSQDTESGYRRAAKLKKKLTRL